LPPCVNSVVVNSILHLLGSMGYPFFCRISFYNLRIDYMWNAYFLRL